MYKQQKLRGGGNDEGRTGRQQGTRRAWRFSVNQRETGLT